MTNSGRPSFAGIRECKPNRRPKLSARPRSPRFEMLPFLFNARVDTLPSASVLSADRAGRALGLRRLRGNATLHAMAAAG
jgi:hypothetical protein